LHRKAQFVVAKKGWVVIVAIRVEFGEVARIGKLISRVICSLHIEQKDVRLLNDLRIRSEKTSREQQRKTDLTHNRQFFVLQK